MKKMKKALCILFSTLILVSVLTVVPITVSAKTSGGYEYSILSNGKVNITKYNGSDTEVSIPNKLDGYTVISIGKEAFYFCRSIISVIIPDSVTSIGSNAFGACTGLTNVTIPDSVTSIGDYAFSYSGLKNVTIPSSVTSIGSFVFRGCTSLRSITIPDSVTSIGDNAFNGCNSLTNVTIPDSVTSIGSFAFGGCTSLRSITIPDNVTSIGDNTFNGCNSLSDLTISDSVTNIGASAFSGCVNLLRVRIYDVASWCKISFEDSRANPLSYSKKLYLNGTHLVDLEIPSSVTSIGDYAFYGCENFTNVTISDSVTSIGKGAFFDCKKLTNITIPDSVISIGKEAFYGCENLTSVKTYNIASWCKIIFEGSYSNPLSYSKKLYLNDTIVSDLVIPSSVTSIGKATFDGCKSLTNVTIPDSVTSIGGAAFANSGLKNVTIPSSVTSIGNSAFWGCTYLNSVTIPDSVTSMGDGAFAFSGLTNVTIPSSVTSIGSLAFERCTNLTNATISDSVTSIGDYAFSYCSKLNSLVIGNSVTSIGSFAFEKCTNLTNVTIPDSVTSIGSLAFDGCTKLTSVKIHDVASWCRISFSDTKANPLYFAHNLYLDDTLVSHLVIPNTVTSIGDNTFYECENLNSVTIPDSVINIGDSAFVYCSNLKSLTIGNNVTSIGNKAFYGSSIKKVFIPDNVVSIGEYAFPNSVTIFSTGTTAEQYVKKSGGTFKLIKCIGDYYYYYEEDGTVRIEYYLGNETKLTIPVEFEGKKVSKIVANAFEDCDNISDIYYNSSRLDWNRINIDVSNNSLLNAELHCEPISVKETDDIIFTLDENEKTLTVVSKNEEAVFSEDSEFTKLSPYIEKIIIEGSFKEITASAFNNYKNLKTVFLSDSIKSFDSAALNDCDNLKDIYYPDSRTEWFKKPYFAMNSYPNITLHFGKPSTGKTGDCDWVYNEETHILTISGNGSMADYTDDELSQAPWYSLRTQIAKVVIEEGVNNIGNYAFADCVSMGDVYIPQSLTKIGSSAFKNCRAIENIFYAGSIIEWSKLSGSSSMPSADITYGKTVSTGTFGNLNWEVDENTHILTISGNGAMQDFISANDTPWKLVNNKITSIVIKDGVTSIGMSAFESLENLVRITIPESVKEIGYYAFLNCNRMREVIYGGTQSQWDNVKGKNEVPAIVNIEVLPDPTTEAPTNEPTTELPTETLEPTTEPITEMPTEVLTSEPVEATSEPMESFTESITESATEEPTEEPTESQSITESVTIEPETDAETTELLTNEPTQLTTIEPTEKNTVSPTEAITAEPTELATVEPTQLITIAPTTVTLTEPNSTEDVTEQITEPDPTVPEGREILCGDVNGDKSISIKDATLIQKHVALIEPILEEFLDAGDVNADNNITIKDATAIQKYLAKLDGSFNVGKILVV